MRTQEGDEKPNAPLSLSLSLNRSFIMTVMTNEMSKMSNLLNSTLAKGCTSTRTSLAIHSCDYKRHTRYLCYTAGNQLLAEVDGSNFQSKCERSQRTAPPADF